MPPAFHFPEDEAPPSDLVSGKFFVFNTVISDSDPYIYSYGSVTGTTTIIILFWFWVRMQKKNPLRSFFVSLKFFC
jgi:hypothetical protein